MPNENFYINGTLSVKNNVIVHEDDVAYTLKDYILNYSASRFEVKHITGDMTQEQLIAELSVHLGDPSTPEIERRTIYFIQKNKSEDNDDFYDEYAWSYSDGSLERIGSTQIDFDNIDKDVTFNGNATFNGDVIVIKDGVEHNVLLDYDIEQVTSAINTVQENLDAHKNNTNVHITDAERYAISLLGKVSHTDITSSGDPNGGAYYKHFVLSSMYAIEGKLTSIHIAGRGGADQGVAGLLVYQMTNANVDTVNSSGGRIPESWILIGKSKERTIQVTGSQGGTWTFDNLVVNPSRRLAFVAVSDSQYDNPSSWQIGSTETPSIGTGWSNRGQGDTTSYAVGSTVFEGSPTFELVYEVSSISSHISNNNIHTTSEEKTILRNLSRGTYMIDDSGMFSLATGGQAGLVAGNYTSTVVVNNNGVSLNAIGNNKTITINGVTTTNSPINSTNVITAAGINDTGNAIISGQMLVGGESVFSAGVTFNDFVDCMGVTSFYNNTFTFEKMKHVILDSSSIEGYRLVDYITTEDVSSIFNEGEIGAMVEEAVNKVVVDQTSNFVKSVTQSNADGSKIQINCNETEAEDGSRNVTVSASYTVPVIGFDENNGATVTTDGLVSASEVVQLFTNYAPIVANIASGSLLGTIQPLEERIESVENTVETLENTVETLENGLETVQGAIEAIDLTDYAKTADIESTYATKTSIEGLASSSDLDSLSERVDNIKGLNFSAVDELPETGESGIIYLVPTTTASDENAKDEYIWTQLESGDGSWELIGSTTVDLSGYLTTETAGNTYATKQEISSLAEKSEVEAVDSKVDEAAGKITTIEGQISDIEGQITDIENQLDDIDLSQYITSDDASITYATKDELTDLAQAKDLEDHVSDNTIHVTAEEKDIINNLEDIVDAKYDKSGGEIEGDVTIGNIVEGDTYATAVFQLDELKYYKKWAVIENKYVESWNYTYPKFKPLTNADVSSYGAFCSAISNEYFTATYDGENVILTSNVIGEDGNFFGLALSVDDSDTRHKLLNCRYITLDGGHCQARPAKGVIRFGSTDRLPTRITYNLSNGVNGDITVENPSQYAYLSEIVEAYPELMLKFDRVMTRTGAVGSVDVMFMSTRNSEEDNGNTYTFYNSDGYPSELVMGSYDDPTQFQQQGAAGDESVTHSITLNGVNVGDTIKRTNAVSSAVSNSSKCESACKISESGEVDGDLYVGRAIDDLSDIQYPSFLIVTGFVDQIIKGANIQNYRVNGDFKQLENCNDFSDPEELCRCLNETGLGIFELRGNDLIVGFDTYRQTASFVLPTYNATSQLDYLTFNEVHHGTTNKSKASLIMPRDEEPTKIRDDNYYFINAVIVDKGNGETVRVTNYTGDPEYARLLSVINENSESLGCVCQLTSDDQYLIQANDYGWDQNNWKLVVIRQKRYGVDIAQLKTEVYQFGSHQRGTGETSETHGDIILNGKSLASFIENKDIHVSTIDRENWNSKVDAEQLDNKFDKNGGLISGNIEIGHGTGEASAAQCKLMGIYPWYDGTLTVGDKTLTVPYNFFVRATGYIELPSETVDPFTLKIDNDIVTPTEWTLNGIASAIAGFNGGDFFETSIEGLRINIRNKGIISSSKYQNITIKASNLPEGGAILFPERDIVVNPRQINQLCDLINQSDLGVTATYESFGVNYNIILTSNEAGSSLNDTSVVGTGTFGKNRSYINLYGENSESNDFGYPIAESVDNVTTLGSLVAGTGGDATEYSLKLNGEELVTRGEFDKHVTVHDSLSEDFSEHINDGSIHLNDVQKDYWNSKLNSYDLPVIESDLIIGSGGDGDDNERTNYQLSVNGNDVFTTAGGNISGDVNIGQSYRMVIDGDFFGFGDPNITFVGGGNVGSLALVADSSIIQQINNTLLTPSVIPYPTGYTPEMAIRVIVRDIESKWSFLFDEISQENDTRHVRLVLKPQYNGLVHGIVWVNKVGYNYLDHSITSLFNEKYVFWNVEHAYQPFYKEFASDLTLKVNGDTVITDNELDGKLTNVVGINGGCVNGRYDIGKNSKTKFYGYFYELTPFSNNYIQSPFPVNGLYFTVTINDEVKLNRELVCDTTIDTSTPLSSEYLNSTSCPLSQYFENLVCEWADKTITGEYKGNINDKVEVKIHGEMLGPSSIESVRCVISNAERVNGELYVMDAKVHTDDDFDHLLVDEKDNVKGDYIYFTEHTVPISTGGQPVEFCDFQDYVDAGFLGLYQVCDKNGDEYPSDKQIKSILKGVTNWNSLSKSSFDTLETVKSVGQLRNGTMERHVYRFIPKRRSTLSNVTDTVNDVHDKVNAISEGYVINEVTDTFEMKHDSAFSSTAAQVSITPAYWTNRVVKSTLLWTPDGDTVNTNNLTGLHTLVIYGIDTPKAGDTLMVELTQIAEDKIVGVMVIVAS